MGDPTALLSQHPVWTALVAACGIAGVVAKGFEWFDAALNDDSRVKLWLWLGSVPGDEQIDAWASVFPNLIDYVFGPKPFSLKFFLRCCIASILAITGITMILTTLNGREWLIRMVNLHSFKSNFYLNFLLMPAFSLFINCGPDFLSVLISRTIVRAMAKKPTWIRILMLLLLDTFLTLALAYLACKLFMPMLVSIADSIEYGESLRETMSDLIGCWSRIEFDLVTNPAAHIFIFASLFTSVWVWLYVLASVAIRILHKAQFVWVKLIRILDIEKKPMQAIGRVAGVMAGCGYLALLGGVWLFKHL